MELICHMIYQVLGIKQQLVYVFASKGIGPNRDRYKRNWNNKVTFAQ